MDSRRRKHFAALEARGGNSPAVAVRALVRQLVGVHAPVRREQARRRESLAALLARAGTVSGMLRAVFLQLIPIREPGKC